MYTIKHAAEQVGVSVATLRAWEQRYGVGAARRTDAGYRIYDDDTVRVLIQMRELIDTGWSVRAAAEEVRRRISLPLAAPTPITEIGRSPAAADDFVDAAASYDADALAAFLDLRFSTTSFETAVDDWLLPSLADLGDAWTSGRVSVAAEHAAAHAVTRRLSGAYDAAGAAREGAPRVLLGLPPGARHDLGLLSFATAARRAGLAASYLGADVPVADWISAVAAQSPDCVVLAIPMADDAAPAADVVAAVEAQQPGVVIAVGGSAQDSAPDHCLRLGHRIGPAAALLAHALGQRART